MARLSFYARTVCLYEFGLFNLALLEAEVQNQKIVFHVTEGNQKMEDWLAN